MPKKNSFLKFLIVPHENGSPRGFRIPLILLFFFLILIVLITVFFMNNLNRYVDITSIGFIKSDNQRLREKIQRLTEERKRLEGICDSLNQTQKEALEEYHIELNGKQPEKQLCLDSLIIRSLWIERVLKSVDSIDDSILNKIPIIKPVDGYIIKKFGKAYDPFTEKYKPHHGINILSGLKTPVVAAGNGKVTAVSKDKGSGLYVEIKHYKKLKTRYSHLFSATVKTGQRIKRGEVIGYVGQSGRAPYPYLYYEIKRDTTYVNPEDMIYGG